MEAIWMVMKLAAAMVALGVFVPVYIAALASVAALNRG